MTPSADPPGPGPTQEAPAPGAAAAAEPSDAGAPAAAPQLEVARVAGAAAALASERRRTAKRLADHPSKSDYEAQIMQRFSQLEEQLRQELAVYKQQHLQELATVKQQLATVTQQLAMFTQQQAMSEQLQAVSEQRQAALLRGLKLIAAHAGIEVPADLQQLDAAIGAAVEQPQEEVGVPPAAMPVAELRQPPAPTQRATSQTPAGAHHPHVDLWEPCSP